MFFSLNFLLFFKKHPFKKIEAKIGYRFKNYKLIQLAFTHRSINNKPNKNFERLELIGDSVLNLIVTDWLLSRYPNLNEGVITQKRSNLVNALFLSKISDLLKLNDFLIINKNNTNKKINLSSKMKSNLYESIIGAIYLDSNLNNAKSFIYRTLIIHENLSLENKNFKGLLIEYCHRKYNISHLFQLVS